jgi:Uma2 family endonuclease
MNEIYRPHKLPATTQAAEGVPRRRWTTAELEHMAAQGMFRDARGNDERFELIGGEVVPMSPNGNRHEVLRDELSGALRTLCPDGVRVSDEPQFNLAVDAYTVPDIMVRPASILSPFVRGPDALLIIEVAETSLPYDLAVKAQVYASFGVREYWVIKASTLETRVFRDPSATGYATRFPVSGETAVVPLLCPELTVKLSDIRLA